MAPLRFSYPAWLRSRASAARKSSLRHRSLRMACCCHLHHICHQPCRRGLTTRSSGAPTAGHQARSGGTRYIFASPGLASCRCRPLSSNVRPRRRDLPLFKMQLLGFASAKHQPRLLPPSTGLLSPVWRQAALAIPHRFVFGHLQRVKPTCGTVRCAWRAPATFVESATNRASVA